MIMRIRFTRACYALAAGAAVSAAIGLAVMGTANASTAAKPAATTVCGIRCNDLFNRALGYKFIPTTNGNYDNSISLTLAHNYLKSQDFIATEVGKLGQFIKNGLIARTSYVALKYPKSWPVFEEQYAPYSVTSGLCAAVKFGNVVQGAPIILRSCGTNARSLWVADYHHRVKDKHSILGYDFPWVNGADGQFSNPLVLTTNDYGSLYLDYESMLGGKVYDSQLWGVKLGPAS
jgi:hypothetical protein